MSILHVILSVPWNSMQANVFVVDDKYNAKGECVTDGSGTAGVRLSEAWKCPK